MQSETLVIIPAYNEEESLETTLSELQSVAPDFDYVIVNDGSRDRTGEICAEHCYNYIDLPVNLGLTGAFQTGMKYAFQNGYQYALQFDADGQHDPACISDLDYQIRNSKADIVIGSRFVTDKKPHSLRMLGSNLISTIISITTGKHINDPTSGMRIYNRRMIEMFAHRADLSPEPDTLAYLIKKKQAVVNECQVKMRERLAGESYLTLSKSIGYMVNSVFTILFAQWFRK